MSGMMDGRQDVEINFSGELVLTKDRCFFVYKM